MLTGNILKNAFISGANNLILHKKEIDALNVFPVPDGDTGINMSKTVSSAIRELEVLQDNSLSAVSKTISGALLRGARGNSGVILSLIFRGIQKSFKGLESTDGTGLAAALKAGSDRAYKAVEKPTEGTILTVIREAADEAVKSGENEKDVIKKAYETAELALAKTPELLPILKKAGVVDAGGQGLCCLLKGMCDYICDGVMISDENEEQQKQSEVTKSFEYSVSFVIKKDNDKNGSLEKLRATADATGSLKEIKEDMGNGIIRVVAESDSLAQLIESATAIGSLTDVKIENIKSQLGGSGWQKDIPQTDGTKSKRAEPVNEFGFVAVAAGEGFTELFKELSCDCVVSGGQTMNPSTDDILNAVESTPAKNVFVLPNNKNIIMAAEQTSRFATRNVYVLPTKTMPMGITALMNFDKNRPAEENHLEMMRAAENTHTATITFAARDSGISDKVIRKGQILGMEDGKISVVEDDVALAAFKTTKRIIKKYDGDVVTVYTGLDATEEMTEDFVKSLSDKYPNLDVQTVFGGQPVYYFIISVEKF
ncbi:MAG: DAK2 domain-containing protein [Candidatus Fimenecus sp.]